MHERRMDLQLTICNENMELIAIARQVMLVLDVHKNFREGRSRPESLLQEFSCVVWEICL